MWIVAWKLANWSLRTHCYKGGHPSVRRTESLKLWKKPPLFLQRNLEDADILLCSDPAIEEQLFWLHHLGCSTAWAFIHICERCCPAAATTRVKGIRTTHRFQHPEKLMHWAGFHCLSTSFENAISFSQMTAQIHAHFKDLVRLKKVIAIGKSANYLILD